MTVATSGLLHDFYDHCLGLHEFYIMISMVTILASIYTISMISILT